MTILEGYFAKIDEYPEDELKLCVASRYPFFVKKHKMVHHLSLAPSEELLKGYMAGEVKWEQYTEKFKDEMRQYPSRQNLAWLKRRDKVGDMIRLLCYEKAEDRQYHRFILLDILNSMEEK
jgi:uncharacterized protein YeaO (DUF488 family)